MSKILKPTIVLFILLFVYQYGLSTSETDTTGYRKAVGNPSWSIFPILMYDSDIGFGFGGKCVIKNELKRKESFDITLFGSTKGEQWYVFIFSIPDFEIRQGTAYPWAFDLTVEYDKLLKSNFFGRGNESEDNDFQFPREFLKLQMRMGHAFTTRIVGEFVWRYSHYSVYDYDPNWLTITEQTPGAGETDIFVFSTRLRYDTRDSQINPGKGFKVELWGDLELKNMTGNWDFKKINLEFCTYRKLFKPNNILAFRYRIEQLEGKAPYQELSKIGGSWTARGYKADRFMDNAMALASGEYRFPIYKKLGGVLFVDAGRVWPKLGKFNLKGWHTDWGFGLRYHLTNFVTRFDMGISQEGTRIFLNFGQVF